MKSLCATICAAPRLASAHALVKASRHMQRGKTATFAAADPSVVSTDKAPAAVGPYSQAIKSGAHVYVSGCIGLVPGTKNLAGDDTVSQTEQVMKNMSAILEAAGSSFDKVVKTTILLADMGDFAAVNEVYAKYFPKRKPARATFAVKALPLGAKVEMECIAEL